MPAPTLPKCSCTYGAPMGRSSYGMPDPDIERYYLSHVRLDAGGYDAGGAYWGWGDRLYVLQDADGCVRQFTRARDRDDAKAILRKEFGEDLRFFH